MVATGNGHLRGALRTLCPRLLLALCAAWPGAAFGHGYTALGVETYKQNFFTTAHDQVDHMDCRQQDEFKFQFSLKKRP